MAFLYHIKKIFSTQKWKELICEENSGKNEHLGNSFEFYERGGGYMKREEGN